MALNHIQLFLGGARSGKSRLAEKTAVSLLDNGQVNDLLYLATAQAKDDEMAERISYHQSSRDARWQVIEEPWHLAREITATSKDTCILIDCLTLWLSYGLCEKNESEFIKQKQQLLEALNATPAHVILVSNEVGHGIVPLGKLSRTFVDQSGWLNQDIAEVANRVDFVMAGCVLRIK